MYALVFCCSHTLSACYHISNEEAMKTFMFIKENFASDIQMYMKNGLLGEAQNGPVDCENWAATELFERAERKQKLQKALLDLENEWPQIVKEGWDIALLRVTKLRFYSNILCPYNLFIPSLV